MSSPDSESQLLAEEEPRERPSQVKRPMNAFMLWSKEKRRKISSVDPSLHNSHISKILGEEWKRLPLQEKDPYIKQSKTLMEKHKKEHPDYHYKPRQNKLTKALKELSSLRSTLSTPPRFTSRIKSLSSMSKLAPHAIRYQPYNDLPSLRSSLVQGRELDDLKYHPTTGYYPRPLPCVGCTCCHLEYQESYAPHYPYHRLEPRASSKEARPCHDERPVSMHGVWRVHAAPSPRYGWSVPFLVDEPCREREDCDGRLDEARSHRKRKILEENDSETENEEAVKTS